MLQLVDRLVPDDPRPTPYDLGGVLDLIAEASLLCQVTGAGGVCGESLTGARESSSAAGTLDGQFVAIHRGRTRFVESWSDANPGGTPLMVIGRSAGLPDYARGDLDFRGASAIGCPVQRTPATLGASTASKCLSAIGIQTPMGIRIQPREIDIPQNDPCSAPGFLDRPSP